ncbi:hypothetical protein OKW24_001368 [Peribacillus simplex]|nr:hypothetical protein [Peribacillus simplex]
MIRTLRIIGILFAIVTVILAIYSFFVSEAIALRLNLSSWVMVSMCLSLIFNGFYFHLEKNKKGSLTLIVMGFSILALVLIDFI